MRYTEDQHQQTAKVYADLIYKRATVEECRKKLNVPKDSGVYRNIKDNVNRIRRMIRHGGIIWKLPLAHVKALYPHIIEKDRLMYLKGMILMAIKYDKHDVQEWARMEEKKELDRLLSESKK